MISQNWIGKTIGGRYQIETFLGQGGMSAVYRAFDPNLRRTVAIKLILTHLLEDPNFVGRFKEEAAAVARLRHPNIVQVHDFDKDGETYYMVMEYLVGETLQTRLKRLNSSGRYYPYSEAIRTCLQMCDAIGYAHNRELIHRDIKPANIMIDVNGQAILMDFGIVKIIGGEYHTMTGATIGTAMYMSPEQIRGERADERSDIYSLGVTLYEMISGHPPYQSGSAVTLMMMVLNDPLPDLRKIRADLPDGLLAVINQALAKDKTKRFQSMAEMAAALIKVQEKEKAISSEATIIENKLAGASLPANLPASEARPVKTSSEDFSRTPSQISRQAARPPTQTGAKRFAILGIGGCMLWVILLGVGGLALLSLYFFTPVLGFLHPATASPTSITAPSPTETFTPSDTPLPGINSTGVRFFDDFSNPASGWDIASDPTYSTGYYQGGYRIVVTDTNTQVWANPGLNFTDAVIEVDTYKSGGVDDNKFGIICRYHDVDNFYYFIISSDGYYGISRKVDGIKEIIGDDNLRQTDTINHGAAANHIRAECIGSSLTLYVNGQLVVSQSDSNLSSGDVGLIAGSYETGSVDILFDDFIVKQP